MILKILCLPLKEFVLIFFAKTEIDFYKSNFYSIKYLYVQNNYYT